MKQELTFNQYLSKVFAWMFFGVVTSFVAGYLSLISLTSGGIIYQLMSSSIGFYLLIFGEIGLVLGLSFFIQKLSVNATRIMFLIYSIFTGISLSILPLAYDIPDIFMAFIGAVVLFAVMASFGKFTKVDLTKFGGILLAMLATLIIVSLLNTFVLKNIMIESFMPYFGVLIFMAITAYDIKKIQKYYEITLNDQEMNQKMIINGALNLYIDLVNIFLDLLAIISGGKKK